MLKALGLDVGDTKIGVAVSDGLGYTAQGVTTFKRSSLQDDLGTIQQAAKAVSEGLAPH